MSLKSGPWTVQARSMSLVVFAVALFSDLWLMNPLALRASRTLKYQSCSKIIGRRTLNDGLAQFVMSRGLGAGEMACQVV
jgi:hypothetical protein